MTPAMIIIALLMMPDEPVTADQIDWYSGPLVIADDGYTTSTEAEE